MNEEIFQSVLNEILDEMKKLIQTEKDLHNTVADLKEKVATFDHRLTKQVVAPPADTLAVQQVLKEGLNKIEQLNADSVNKINGAVTNGFQKTSQVVEEQPKAVIRQLRFVFYPEYSSENYRFTLSRILLFIVVLIILCMTFTIVREHL